MSLETLLEAAEFIEWRSKEDEPCNFHPYAKKAPLEPVKIERVESCNSFDYEDEEEDSSRERRRPGGAGTREVHNKLEKNRRAHLKECFNFLKKSIPSLEDRRTSNLGILRGSLRYIQTLRRKEREHEAEMQKLAKDKISLQGKIHILKAELHKMNIQVDLNAWMHAHAADNESHSTSTATEGATPPPSDHGDDDDEEEADQLAMETNPSPVPKVITKRLPSVRELLHNGTSPKVLEAVQGLMAANKVHQNQNSVRPLLPLPPKSASTQSSEIPQTVAIKTSAGQIIIPKQYIPVSLAVTPPGTLALPPGVSVRPQTVVPQQTSVSQQMSVSQQTTVSQQMSVAQQTPPVSRTPVTQILHQTLTQRQALQKQTNMTPQVVSAPLTAAKLKSPPLSKTPIPITMTTTTSSLLTKDSASGQTTPIKYIATPVNLVSTPLKQDMPVTSSFNFVSLPVKLETTLSTASQEAKQTSAPVSLSVPYYMASLPKFAHPILVTSLTAPTLAALVSASVSSSATAPITTTKTQTSSLGSAAMVTTSSITPVMSVSQTSASGSVPSSQLAAGLQVRPFLAQNILGGPFLPLIAHTIPQTSISTMSSSPVVTTAVSGQFSTVPLMSLAQINPLTQIVSPVTVMSPGMQLGSAGLTQSQLNNMLAASPLLKQFSQIPLITPSLLQSGQVLGQQVVKPVVVVSVPNMVTTSSISLPTSSAIVKSD